MGRGPRHDTRQVHHPSTTTGQNLFLFLISSLFRVSALSTQFLTLHTDNAITKNNIRGKAERPEKRERKRPREEAQTHSEGQLQRCKHFLCSYQLRNIVKLCQSTTSRTKRKTIAVLQPAMSRTSTEQQMMVEAVLEIILKRKVVPKIEPTSKSGGACQECHD